MMAVVKLAEALLRRKELQGKVDQLRALKDAELVEIRGKRVNITDAVDEVTAAVLRFHLSELTQAFDWHARQLRLVDAAIQQANWTTDIEVAESVHGEFVPSVPTPLPSD